MPLCQRCGRADPVHTAEQPFDQSSSRIGEVNVGFSIMKGLGAGIFILSATVLIARRLNAEEPDPPPPPSDNPVKWLLSVTTSGTKMTYGLWPKGGKIPGTDPWICRYVVEKGTKTESTRRERVLFAATAMRSSPPEPFANTPIRDSR